MSKGKPICKRCHHMMHDRNGKCVHREKGILCSCSGYLPSRHMAIVEKFGGIK